MNCIQWAILPAECAFKKGADVKNESSLHPLFVF